MTKQEEIREGIAKIIYNYTSSTAGDELCLEELLWYLHSQGVVIKVAGELPATEVFFPHHVTEECCRVIMEYMLKAGYVAVEPLIKEE